MKKMMKKAAAICMVFVIMLSFMPLLGSQSGGVTGAQTVFAETVYENVQPDPPDGFVYTIYAGEDGASIWITGYVGTNTQVILPTSVTYKDVTYDAWDSKNNTPGNGAFVLGATAFAGNTKVTKIAVPYGYEALDNGAFKGCTGLTEVAIADTVGYVSNDIFDGCDNLTTYCYSGDQLKQDFGEDTAITMLINTGIAQDADGNPLSGITVYTKPGSIVEKAVEKIDPTGDKIKVVTVDDPYSKNTVKPEKQEDGGNPDGGAGGGTDDSTDGGGSSSAGQKGEDGTAYGKGASANVADKAITGYAAEKDPKGTVFGLLQAKIKKTTKTSVTLQWKKVKGAKKYVIYGNACGKKNKLTRIRKTSKTKVVFKKVNKKKVKKGTYYKFMIVALDKNNKVITTSKIVHATTKGGKGCNDKTITTKAKKSKVTIKKGKTFKLKAKPVAQSKKLKVYRHRGVSYESSNKKVAAVNSEGVIKGKKKGTCYVYAYAQNGVFKKIKVTVK